MPTPEARATQPVDRAARPMGSDPPLHVVLVEPEIPPNTGNVARLCAATGCALHLIGPLGFSIDDRALKRAGLDYWDHVDVRVHVSFEAFRATCDAPLWLLSTRGTVVYTRAAFARGDAIVFGKETAGLPQALLDAHPGRDLRVPMRPNSVRSLNLSTTVGVVTYAALDALGFPELT